MALKGTLKDFGIADILQLIGQQQKTGLLHLRSKDQEVHVVFKEGNIIKAESTTRKKKELIGSMLVRAGIIDDRQLEEALETQRRTLKRLGDVLVSMGVITDERFRQMVQLQTTETLYRLFQWKTGTYAFEQKEVDFDPSDVTSLRAESVLMEGFRMVDEWPVIRKTITSDQMTFVRLQQLPPPTIKGEDFDNALNDAFSESDGTSQASEFRQIGPNERRLYELASPGRTVRTLIDLSCIGEFETCKALLNLVTLGYLRALPGTGRSDGFVEKAPLLERLVGAAARTLVVVLVLGALGFVATRLDLGAVDFSVPASRYEDPAAQRFVSRQQLARIEAALRVYRAEQGSMPPSLDQLVEKGLLAREDLRYPWRDPYYYRRTDGGGFVLLPPLR